MALVSGRLEGRDLGSAVSEVTSKLRAMKLPAGATLLDGNGEVLTFGGQVIKNVAGYDVSRLMAGALGTLVGLALFLIAIMRA